MCDLGATVRQRMLRVLESKDSRPRQSVNVGIDPLKHKKHRSRLTTNTLLGLIVERPVETIQVEIQQQFLSSSVLVATCKAYVPLFLFYRNIVDLQYRLTRQALPFVPPAASCAVRTRSDASYRDRKNPEILRTAGR
jgi:hypothetical protein